ncbi:sensor histidine kinase [Raoultella terrigena]|uniref:sensor histidine kinase n=1 Tax=Raoultella terrigena TaxID=577 RepID=UPI001F5226BB|nr:ATP-binding protein [Raoultella terrigena]MCI1034746.1 two-component sensor histidine kinase [Raoultella terrigena]
MKNTSLWRWISTRIIIVVISMVFVIAFAMWSTYAIQYYWEIYHMSPSVYAEFTTLLKNPEINPARLHEIIDASWGIDFSIPSLTSQDWGRLFILVIIATPFIIIRCLRTAHPLTVQFGHLTEAADIVAKGDFNKKAQLISECPEEMLRFSNNFNNMIEQLAVYERELKASHVSAAHELRSPLTAAIGRLQGMIDNVFPADEKQLQMVMTQLQNLSRLTDDLHFLSLANAGQLTMQIDTLNINKLLNERVAWLKPQLEEAMMSVQIEAPENYFYTGDEFRLGQVFTIVVENMLRYCSAGDNMLIKLDSIHNTLVLTFQDSGPGVPSEYLPHMFDRFTRGERSRARDSGGSGLGLSIAKAICVAHGGDITAMLPPTGKGLLITMSLPGLRESLH